MEDLEIAKSVAKKCNATAIVKKPDWKNMSVWEMLFYDPNDEKIPIVGIPQFIFINSDGLYRIGNDSEAMDYMQSLNEDETDEEEEIIEI